MSTEVVISETPSPEVTTIEGEVVESETAATLADASVKIARIEADKQIAVAEIQAATTETVVAAEIEAAQARAVSREEMETCLQNIEALRLETSAIRTEMSLIREALTKPEPAPPSHPEPVASEVTRDSPEGLKPPMEKPKARKSVTWI